MAPTACFIDYPRAGSDATSSPRTRHRPGRDGFICKRQRLTMKQFPKIAEGIRTSPLSIISTGVIREADTPSHPMLPDANLPGEPAAQHTSFVINRRKELMDIVVRTLALVRRNYILQVRLDSLRLEAKNFFKSVLKNPESECCDENHDNTICNDDSNSVSFATDDKMNEEQRISIPVSNGTPPLISPPNNQVTSTCISSSQERTNSSNNHCKISNS